MTTRPRADESHTVAIAGANGMVGHRLVEALQASGDRVIALVRQPSAHHFPSAVEIRRWQASDPVAPVDGAHAVVNLVGDPTFARPRSQTRKQELTQTRLLATRSLVEGIRKIGGEGCTFISSTAVEYAGDTGNRQVDEKAAPATGGFLAELAQVWEAEAQRVRETGARLVLLQRIANWSLTSLQQRLVKTGGRLIKHARYYRLLLAESHLTRRLFGSMLRRMAALPLPTGKGWLARQIG